MHMDGKAGGSFSAFYMIPAHNRRHDDSIQLRALSLRGRFGLFCVLDVNDDHFISRDFVGPFPLESHKAVRKLETDGTRHAIMNYLLREALYTVDVREQQCVESLVAFNLALVCQERRQLARYCEIGSVDYAGLGFYLALYHPIY